MLNPAHDRHGVVDFLDEMSRAIYRQLDLFVNALRCAIADSFARAAASDVCLVFTFIFVCFEQDIKL